MHKKIIVLLTMGLSLSAIAEMRIWSDKKGNTLEAEYVCQVAGKITLRGADGKDYRLTLSSLSQKDQQFLQTLLPPKLEIDFTKKQDRRKTSDYSATLDITCSTEITKKSRMPYERELKAVMVVMGYQDRTNEYRVLDRAESSFKFSGKNKTHEFTGNRFRIYEYDSYYSNDNHMEYRGHIIAIYDTDNELVALKSTHDLYETNVDKLISSSTGERFDRKMKSLKQTRSY